MSASTLPEFLVDLSQYAVVGTKRKSRGHYVTHVAILRDAVEVFYDCEVDVYHMRPPLIVGDPTPGRTSNLGKIKIHVYGCIDMDDFERDQIQNYLAKLASIASLDLTPLGRGLPKDWVQYQILPAKQEIEFEGQIVPLCSCAGFICLIYDKIHIQLCEEEWHPFFPWVDQEVIERIYPVRFHYPEHRFLLKACGLGEDGPWPVLLPGHIIHAFNRSEVEIRTQPFLPEEWHCQFPA